MHSALSSLWRLIIIRALYKFSDAQNFDKKQTFSFSAYWNVTNYDHFTGEQIMVILRWSKFDIWGYFLRFPNSIAHLVKLSVFEKTQKLFSPHYRPKTKANFTPQHGNFKNEHAQQNLLIGEMIIICHIPVSWKWKCLFFVKSLCVWKFVQCTIDYQSSQWA